MKSFRLCFILTLAAIFISQDQASAQDTPLKNNYIGFIPAALAEPYDTINAVEVNFSPFMYEFRINKRNDLGFQIRPILNYRFFKPQPGFSQIGGTLEVNKYFLDWFGEDFWLVPQIAVYYAYTYNRLDKIQTMTFGIEPGVLMKLSNDFSLSVTLQPGINYYPDAYSKEFVKSESGFKSHFGLFFHVGYNF